MSRLSIFFTGAILLISLQMPAAAEAGVAAPSAQSDSVLTDTTLGISFRKIAPAFKRREGGYEMRLEESSGKLGSPAVSVSTSLRPSVDLSGSYGGRVYLDDPHARSVLKNRMSIDSVTAGGLTFRREIWVAYAGMGAWEGVLNCYAFQNGRYYNLSLHAGLMMGKPGAMVDEVRLRAEDIRTRIADLLKNNDEPAIRAFNDLVSSFHVSR